MKKQIELVIFDLDGVILNSEPLHDNAKRRILSEAGVDKNVDLAWSVGRPNKELWNMMIDKYGLKKTADELEKTQYMYILEEIEEKQINLTNGLIELLDWLKEKNKKIGLASSSNRFYVLAILRYYKISTYFSYIVGGDEVDRKKPSPDVYLKVLGLSGESANNSIALEDSKAGSEAAVSAGISCVGYLNPTSGEQELSKCIATISHIEQIKDLIV